MMVARESARTIANEVREYVVLGHELEVQLRGDGQWRVVVDGVESPARFAAPYDAWAAGAAESYRQGRTQGTPRLHD